MKRKEKIASYRGMSLPEIKAKLRECAEELMRLRFKKSGGQLEQSHRLGELRSEMAQAKTILREKICAQ